MGIRNSLLYFHHVLEDGAHRLEHNFIPLVCGTFFANGQAYVALSRVKTFTQLHLLSFDPTKAIKVSQCVRGLYGMECNRSSEVTNMPECTAADTATTTTTTTPQTETEPIQTEVSAAVSLPTIDATPPKACMTC